jgi:nicotinic acid phosphoribosyltransferase
MPKRVSVEKPKKPRNSNKDKKIKKPANTRRRNMRGGASFTNSCGLPVLALTDSYKLSHQLMYPDKNIVGYGVEKMVAYGECRGPLKIEGDTVNYKYKEEKEEIPELRIVNFGLRYIIENYINKKIDKNMITEIISFYKTHGFLKQQYPINEKILNELEGRYPPVRIYGLREGTVMLPHTPVYVIEAEGIFAPFVTYFETILTMIWYPISVATLSKCCKDIFTRKYIEINAPEHHKTFINYSLHDFGFRGSSSIETSTIGGMAHLLNFEGTDTLSAAYYAQHMYNGGKEVGESIAASEHSVMTSYKKEFDAFYQILINFAGGRAEERDKPNIVNEDNKWKEFLKPPFAVVMDSYDYENALINVFAPAIKKYIDEYRKPLEGNENVPFENHYSQPINLSEFKSVDDLLDLSNLDNGIFGEKTEAIFSIEEIKLLPLGFAFTFRPDSGNPYVAVIQSLIAGLKMFGIDEQGSFYNEQKKILYVKPKFVRTIQGDGINVFTIQGMLDAITNPDFVSTNGRWAFSPYSLLCGMGGGLLQKVNRDTVNFATKLCHVQYDTNDTNTDAKYKIVMKDPATAPDKRSLPGKPYVKEEGGILMSFVNQTNNIYKQVHNYQILNKEENSFKEIDELLNDQGYKTWTEYANNTKRTKEELIYLKTKITEKQPSPNYTQENLETLKILIQKKIGIKKGGTTGEYGEELILYYDGIKNKEDYKNNANGCMNQEIFNEKHYFNSLRESVKTNWEKVGAYRDLPRFKQLKDKMKFSAISKELSYFQDELSTQMKSNQEEKNNSQYVNSKIIGTMERYDKDQNSECLKKSPFIVFVNNSTDKEKDKIKPIEYKPVQGGAKPKKNSKSKSNKEDKHKKPRSKTPKIPKKNSKSKSNKEDKPKKPRSKTPRVPKK